MGFLVSAAKEAYSGVSDIVSTVVWKFDYLSKRGKYSSSLKTVSEAARSAANSLKHFTGYLVGAAAASMVAASFFKTEECYTPPQECTTIPAGWFTAAELICKPQTPSCSEIEPSLTVVMPVVALALGTAYVASKLIFKCYSQLAARNYAKKIDSGTVVQPNVDSSKSKGDADDWELVNVKDFELFSVVSGFGVRGETLVFEGD